MRNEADWSRRSLLAILATTALTACGGCGGNEGTAPAAPGTATPPAWSGPGTNGPGANGPTTASPLSPGPRPAPGSPPPAAASSGATAGGSPGCGLAAKTGIVAKNVPIMGRTRAYATFVPEGYDPRHPYPVVFVLHGGGGNAAGARAQFDLERISAGKAILVYPDAVNGNWDLDAPTGKNADVALFDAALAQTQSTTCVDLQRVFVTGFSNGAYMANQLGCRRGDRIRAIASHAGGGPYENAGTYDEQGHLVCAGRPVAALIVHGSRDGTVAPSEGDKSLEHWSFANRCNGGQTSANGLPKNCTRAACDRPVAVCKVPGLGHSVWSEGRDVTWSFFTSLDGPAR